MLYKKLVENNTILAGPCVIESYDTLARIAEVSKEACEKHGFSYVFKASFDKANRTSLDAKRGPGLHEGLEILQKIKDQFHLPIVSDIHESSQADIVKDVLDIIQIPAFLCRQTDLLISAGKTGKIVNIKKAQFLKGASMKYPIDKVLSTNNNKIFVTERGSLMGYGDLVLDVRNILEMQKLNFPVIFDATHSAQTPGKTQGSTGGDRELIPYYSYVAASVGVKSFFFETHPNPENAYSDAQNTLELSKINVLLQNIKHHIELAKNIL